MRDSTIQRAQGRWRYILPELGLDVGYLKNHHGPCPVCGGNDRFRFDDKNGSGSWFCTGCDPQSGYGIHLAMNLTGMSMPEVSKEIDSILGDAPEHDPAPAPAPERDPRPALKSLARRSQLLGDRICAVRRYLRTRGVKPAPETRSVGSQGYWEDGQKVGEYPAMAHLVSDKDGNPATWHITYLTERGEKAPVSSAKKLMTPSRDWKGGAIRLCCKYSDGKTLGIAEGVETALACADWLGHPVWAAVNANNLAAFEPPEWVERLVIFADNDGTFTGQAAAFELARRMKVKRKMKAVEVEVPIEQETDFADELAG